MKPPTSLTNAEDTQRELARITAGESSRYRREALQVRLARQLADKTCSAPVRGPSLDGLGAADMSSGRPAPGPVVGGGIGAAMAATEAGTATTKDHGLIERAPSAVVVAWLRRMPLTAAEALLPDMPPAHVASFLAALPARDAARVSKQLPRELRDATTEARG